MAFDTFSTGTLEVFSPIFGSSLNIPVGFFEPGSASIHKLHCGQGAVAAPFSASLVVGPSATSPLSMNTIGLNNHLGIRNIFGSDIKIGSNISLGALDISYNAVGTELNGLKGAVVPEWSATTPKFTASAFRVDENSPDGNLNGFWKYNNTFISVGPHTSDIRLKKNIEPLTNGLDKILKLNPVTFDWDEEIVPDLAEKYPHMVGLIAQEVEKIVPEIVCKTMVNSIQDGKEKGRSYKRVLYENLVAHLIDGMKEQQKQIEELKQRVSELEN